MDIRTLHLMNGQTVFCDVVAEHADHFEISNILIVMTDKEGKPFAVDPLVGFFDPGEEMPKTQKIYKSAAFLEHAAPEKFKNIMLEKTTGLKISKPSIIMP